MGIKTIEIFQNKKIQIYYKKIQEKKKKKFYI